jgi:phospholipase C
MRDVSRRGFLAGAAAVVAGSAILAACDDPLTRGIPKPKNEPELGNPNDAPFDTVVVLMMENRSFDSFLGWLPGADGKQHGLSYPDNAGHMIPTFPLAPDWRGCRYHGPLHDFASVDLQFNHGAMDGWLKTQPPNDAFPLGYYTAADLPITAALARHYTAFDRYFCSFLGPTWPNRIFTHSATTDIDFTGVYPTGDIPRPVQLDLAIWDRLADAGVSAGYYSIAGPVTGLYASKKYDSITHAEFRFFEHAANGTLPHVSYIDPDYTTPPAIAGHANSDHPDGNVHDGEMYIRRIYEALRQSPQWDRMVFVLTFDEHGGFFDHVTPPPVDTDIVIPGAFPQPNFDYLGVRVPTIAMGPFAPRRVEKAGPYEHCSILRMIEWRWGLEPMTRRDATARNLAHALDFQPRHDTLELASFDPGVLLPCGPEPKFDTDRETNEPAKLAN